MRRVSNKQCRSRCERQDRIYAAISNELKSLKKSNGRPWRGSYVFKVGSGKACWDRETSANGVDIHGNRRKDGQPSYAGVSDWEITGCWPAAGPKQDDEVFRPWAKKHILWVKPGVFDSTRRKRKDLYCLLPDQVAFGRWEGTLDRQNDEIVEEAIKELRIRIDAGLIPDLTKHRQQG